MKRGAVAIPCALALVLAILLPFAIGGQSGPSFNANDAASQVTAVSAEEATSESATQATSSANDAGADLQPEYVPGVVLVGIDDGVTIEQVNERLSQLGYISTESITESDVKLGYVELSLADGVGVDEALTMLEQEDFVGAAQPNHVYHTLDAADDGAADLQAVSVEAWEAQISALAEAVNDKYASAQWGLDAVNAYDAWELAKGNHAVTVAVLDSGVKTDHEDLQGALVGARSFMNDDQDDVTDLYGHGTHVSGIIAATANNEIGVAGVTYNGNVMPVQIMDSSGNTNDKLAIDGIDYVIENAEKYNVKVINLSLGSSPVSKSNYDSYAKAYQALLGAMQKANDAGILVVCSAGNRGSSGAYYCFPCDFDESSVGVINATRENDSYVRYSTSNYNLEGETSKELSAPGASIVSTWNKETTLRVNNTSESNVYYRSDTGTSMAAPFVSGVAALLFACDPTLTPGEVKSILCETAQDIGDVGFDLETGYGMVDAKAAVEKVLESKDNPDDPEPAHVHVWDEGVVTTPATCETDGVRTYTCSGCGVQRTEAIPATGHDWDDGIVTIEPTETEEGERTYTCRNDSSHTRTEVIPAKGGSGEPDNPDPEVQKQSMHRLYNLHSGEHFYTASEEERDNLVSKGWIYEGVGWYAPTTSATPVYRLYNSHAGEHHYTVDPLESKALIKAGWIYEGVAWYADDAASVPVYRQYNPNAWSCNHNFTVSADENAWLVAQGWLAEGIAWYGVA